MYGMPMHCTRQTVLQIDCVFFFFVLKERPVPNLNYFFGAVRTYVNSTQGTINYSTGQVTINSLNVSVIENRLYMIWSSWKYSALPK